MPLNLFRFLIDPVSPELFAKSYWERVPLFINRNVHDYYGNILEERDIDQFLGRKDLYYPLLKLVKNGEELPKAGYLKNSVAVGIDVIDADKVFSLYNSGSTIIVQKAQLSIAKISAFCEQLEHELSFSLSANLYVTPIKSKGFNPHYDTHDVFILQIAGRKCWDFYNSPVTLPLNNQSLSKADSDKYLATNPDRTIELSPGDLLYIPRGCVHHASTNDSTSIHITLGVFPHKRIDLVRKMLENAEGQIEFRKYIPTIFSTKEEKDFFTENFKTIIKALIDKSSIDDLLVSFSDNFLAERFSNHENRFLNNKNLSCVGLETYISLKKNLSYKLHSEDKESVSLRFFDKEMKFPSFIEISINSMLSSAPIKVKDIAGQIDDDSKIVLVKRLVLEGFLTTGENEI